MRKFGAYFSCVLVFSFFLANGVLASQEITGSAGVRLAYHDNLFLEESNEQDDLLTHLFAQVGFIAKRPRAELNLDYRLNFIFYKENSSLDETDIEDVQRLSSRLLLGDWSGFSLLLEDNIERVTVDESGKDNEDSDAVNKTNRNTFRATPSFERALGHNLTFRADYQFEDVTHTNTAADERRSQAVSSRLTLALSARSKVYLRGLFRDVDAQQTVDYTTYEALLGGTYALTKTSSMTVEAGAATSEHEEEAKETTALWTVTFSAPTGSKTTTTLDISQTQLHSEIDGLYKSRLWSLSARYKGRMSATASIFHIDDDYLNIDRDDIRTGGGLDFDMQLTPMLTAKVGGKYTWTKLEPIGEEKDTFRALAAVTYEGKHFGLTGSYSYQQEDSNIALNDYVSNVFFVELSARM